MIAGSCLCGDVQYQYAGDFGVITICHCSVCRKVQGASSVVAAPVSAGLLMWTRGQEAIREFESSLGKKRAFCGRCGTPLYSRRDDAPDVLRLRMGSIDTSTTAVPFAHIYTKEVPAWAALDDDLPRYEGREPERR